MSGERPGDESMRDERITPGPGGPRRAFHLPASSARLDAEVDEEFRFHLEERRDQLIAEGMSREEADAEVRRRFGDPETYRRTTRRIDADGLRSQRRADFFRTLWRETRHASRTLLRQRAFSFIAFITLALGLGATAAMFAVLDSVVLRPLPYHEAGQLVAVLHPATVPGSGERRWGVSPGGYFEFRERSHTLTNFGIYRNFSQTVTSGGDAEMTRFSIVTHGIFDALRAHASLGRLLDANDDKPGAPQVAVLSHEYHQHRFGGDPRIVGTTLNTGGGGSYEIVGVTSPGLTLPMPGPFANPADLSGFGVDVWIAMRLDPAGPFYNNHPNVGLARLVPGITAEDATRDLASIVGRFTELVPNAYSERFMEQYNFRVEATPLREAVLGKNVPRVLWMLFGAVVLVLVIAAANVGNLFLVRMEARRHESALRTALGADRTHMAAHHLSESLLLCGAASLTGIALAAGALELLIAIAPAEIPRLGTVALGGRAVAFILAVGLLLGVLLGIVPLLRKGLDVGSIRDGSRGLSASPRQRFARNTLVVGQIALTLMLLTAAGLVLRSFSELRQVRPGFDPAHTLTFSLSLPFSEFDTREKAAVFHRTLQDRLLALPGVVAVGGGYLPMKDFGTGCSVVFRENRPFEPGEETPCVSTPPTLPGYFDALGITVEGRVPTWSDVDARTQAVVVTRALADRLWPGENPIDRGIASNGPDSPVWYRVVGVVNDLRAEALDAPPTEAVFYAATGLQADQRSGVLNDLPVLVRTDGTDPLSLVNAVRTTVRELHPGVPFITPRTMDQIVARSMARTSFLLTLLGIAAAIALLLSAVGIYGVVSYLVTQRRAEIGIRMALGATVPRVVRMVVVQSVRLAVVGVVIGLAASLAGARVLQSMLFDVSPTDPVVLGSVIVLLVAVVVTASFAPARRAARIDPVEAMRG